jgi:hypothetical protein
MKTSGIVGLVLLGIVALFGLTWAIQGNQFFLYKVFAPQMEEARREVFENTKSYQQGTIQNLRRMQEEYVTADTQHQGALASIILHTAADFPEADMPADIKAFVSELKRKHGLAQ